MTRNRKTTAVLAVAAIATGALFAPATAEAAQPGPVRALTQAAHPLRTTEPDRDTADLRALGAMIGDAQVTGLGEATHGSHEFFAMKERLFRYLVEQKGFTTFALEVSWSAGLKIDEFVQTGTGDAHTVAKAALAGSPWDREEFVHLIEWMRGYNRAHPARPVHFLGDDLGAPTLDDAFFGRVTGYVQRTHPESLARLNELYTGLRPIDDVFAYVAKPLAERQRLAAQAQEALELVQSFGDDWAAQNARSIAQTTKFLTIDLADPASVATSQRFRDEVMAQNVVWWQRHTGAKILLSAHNGHVGYASGDPARYPKTQGSFLRDTLGANYVATGFTFDRGSFLSQDDAGTWRKFTVGAAGPGSNEDTLDRVRYQDYYLDLRTAPAAARAWLDVARPTYDIGTAFPVDPADIALARSYDLLIHLHDVREAAMART
ncbi:erythromycin esterase family protein [Amycolatopsis sp. NBC_01307]|uniref:erythromycin esterase family protein n=1 Tax=Amycolatopsis sp. NBC_01307 TaxID=2903561 RepID=UPI002E0F296C|nr:erythromycin esterase family protein [Amycolatopsis sp. NBC_01307]